MNQEMDKTLKPASSKASIDEIAAKCAREAIGNFGWPEAFNTDQECQYTSEQFTRVFNWEGCLAKLSVDVNVRAYDNIL